MSGKEYRTDACAHDRGFPQHLRTSTQTSSPKLTADTAAEAATLPNRAEQAARRSEQLFKGSLYRTFGDESRVPWTGVVQRLPARNGVLASEKWRTNRLLVARLFRKMFCRQTVPRPLICTFAHTHERPAYLPTPDTSQARLPGYYTVCRGNDVACNPRFVEATLSSA